MSLDLSSNGIQSLHHLSDTKNHHLRFFSSVEKLALTDNLITTIPDKFFEVGINGDITFAMYEGLLLGLWIEDNAKSVIIFIFESKYWKESFWILITLKHEYNFIW